MNADFYLSRLYPFQDEVLRCIASCDTRFYLSGGTAVSRGYVAHRFSDDLDLFVNDDERFSLWADRIVGALAEAGGWRIAVLVREERFVRIHIDARDDLNMKVEMVNDVPSHIGEVRTHATLGRIDSPENLLANKLTAIVDREEAKDLADIWGLTTKLGLSIERALDDAHSKAAGLFPPDLARVLLSASRSDWELIRWHDAPDPERYIADLHKLGQQLLLVA